MAQDTFQTGILKPDGLDGDITLFSNEKLQNITGERTAQEVVNETLVALVKPKSTAWQLV